MKIPQNISSNIFTYEQEVKDFNLDMYSCSASSPARMPRQGWFFWIYLGEDSVVAGSTSASQETPSGVDSLSASALVKVVHSEELASIGCGGRAYQESISGLEIMRTVMGVEEGHILLPAWKHRSQ